MIFSLWFFLCRYLEVVYKSLTTHQLVEITTQRAGSGGFHLASLANYSSGEAGIPSGKTVQNINPKKQKLMENNNE